MWWSPMGTVPLLHSFMAGEVNCEREQMGSIRNLNFFGGGSETSWNLHTQYIYIYILQSITIAHTHIILTQRLTLQKHHWTARLYLDVLDYVWTNSRLNRRSTEAISAPGRKRLIRKEQFSTNRASDLNRMAITQEHNYHWWSALPIL